MTTAAICGSNLHMYEGRAPLEPGTIFGHENLGVIEEVGEAVTSVRRGDRVVLPFNIACGFWLPAIVRIRSTCSTTSFELPLEAAPDAYEKFDLRADGYTKVLLKPAIRGEA